MAGKDAVEKQELLKKCAMTTLSSKLVGGEKEFFGKMCVDAVMALDQDTLDPRMIGRGLHSFTSQLNLSRFGHTSPCPPV
jgi:chaperonin GroEL (HSP60 family)